MQSSQQAGFFKDATIDALGKVANVAQFVSFDPSLAQRYSRVRGFSPNHIFTTLDEAVERLFASSPERSLNVRSFSPDSPRSREFVYGVKSPQKVATEVRRLAAAGLHTIVNETVDIDDGGVSGVVHGGVMEFSPGDTPRCVEKPGTVSTTRALGMAMLETVYGFSPSVDYGPDARVEFSIHPLRRGYLGSNTIVWELEHAPLQSPPANVNTMPHWPNRFSRLIGDKAFGLLVAHCAGMTVPRTHVSPRAIAPFTFGTPTGTGETWLRTCPRIQVPGRYATMRGWTDPYKLMHQQDPSGEMIASILAQDGVGAQYSGALATTPGDEPLIEGVKGFGTAFMQSEVAPEQVPSEVTDRVRSVFQSALALFGPVRFEWVYDGKQVWVVQFHRGMSHGADVVYPGEPKGFVQFDVSEGLEALRALVGKAKGSGEGVVLVGRVGRTSHMCDLLRQEKVPSRIRDTIV